MSLLSGQMLIAMPQMGDPRFQKSVILLCQHSEEGAMGLVVNKPVEEPSMAELAKHLGIDGTGLNSTRIHFGGPVEPGRGFVLHSSDYKDDGTVDIAGGIALTATTDILRAIGSGLGPRRRLFALGYAGWGPGQLDAEIQANGWLNVAPDEELIFGADGEAAWRRAIAKLGADPFAISGDAGHA